MFHTNGRVINQISANHIDLPVIQGWFVSVFLYARGRTRAREKTPHVHLPGNVSQSPRRDFEFGIPRCGARDLASTLCKPEGFAEKTTKLDLNRSY